MSINYQNNYNYKVPYALQFNSGVFKNKNYITSINLNKFDWVNNNMSDAFAGCSSLSSISNFSINITNMSNTFNGCYSLNNIDQIPSKVSNLNNAFSGCSRLNVEIIIPEGIKALSGTFSDCSSFNQNIIIPNSVVSLTETFKNCSALYNGPIIPGNVVSLINTFSGCSNLNNVNPIPDSVKVMNGTFSGCSNLTYMPKISNNVESLVNCFQGCSLLNSEINIISNNLTNISSAFDGCTSLTGNIYIQSDRIINTTSCFGNTTLEKNVFIPIRTNDNQNTITYNAFNAAGYSDVSRVNGVQLFDINGDPAFRTWIYNSFDDGSTILYKYIGSNTSVVVPNKYTVENASNISILSNYDPSSTYAPFYNNRTIESVNLNNVQIANNDGNNLFCNCVSLTFVNNFNQSIINLDGAFANCSSLVTAPTIPNSVNYMSSTFYNCTSLVNGSDIIENGSEIIENAIKIPDNVIEMIATFYNCSSLINAPAIPSGVTDMTQTFSGCSSITNTPAIPSGVTELNETFKDCVLIEDAPILPITVVNMNGTFDGCSNLSNIGVIQENTEIMSNTFNGCNKITGEILIQSNKVSNAENCFNGTDSDKIIYMYFNTTTYDSFTNAGYSNYNRVNGVLLKDISDRNTVFADWRYTTNNETKTLYEYLGNNTTIVVPNTSTIINNYTNGETTRNSNAPFYNNRGVVNVDLMYVPFVDNDMSNAFYNDGNLLEVININQNITNMSNTFNGCYNFNQSIIIPNNVTDMSGTFTNCSSFNQSIVIPNSVTNMSNTFSGCDDLTEEIRILSTEITDATNCFNGTFSNKIIYIPFTYDDGITNTPTYEAFLAAGYIADPDVPNRKNGVLLKDIDGEDINLDDYEYDYNTDIDGYRIVTLTRYINLNTVEDIITPHLTEE